MRHEWMVRFRLSQVMEFQKDFGGNLKYFKTETWSKQSFLFSTFSFLLFACSLEF